MSQQPITSEQITHMLAAHLPGFSVLVRTDREEKTVLTNGTHTLVIGPRYGNALQWHVSAYATEAVRQAYHYGNDTTRIDSINISQAKSIEQIARDIQRRMLPQVSKAGDWLNDRMASLTRQGEEYTRTVEQIRAVCPDRLNIANQKDNERDEIITGGMIYPLGKIGQNIYSAEISAGYGVTMKVHRAPAELAARIFATVRDYQEEQRQAQPVDVPAEVVPVAEPITEEIAPEPAPEVIAEPTPSAEPSDTPPARVKVSEIVFERLGNSAHPMPFSGGNVYAKVRAALLMESFGFPKGNQYSLHRYCIKWENGEEFYGALQCRNYRDAVSNLDVARDASETLRARATKGATLADRESAARMLETLELGGATNGK